MFGPQSEQSIVVPGLKVRYNMALQRVTRKGFLQRVVFKPLLIRSQNAVLLFKSMWQAMEEQKHRKFLKEIL